MKKQILVVDDHPLIHVGLQHLLDEEGDLEISHQATNAEDALAYIQKQQTDLMIVDISLGGTNGLELVKQVRSLNPGMPVLVSSIWDESTYAERALRAGAKGFINKQESPEVYVKAIRRVLDGKVHVSDAMNEQLLERALEPGDYAKMSPAELLTDRELEVFELIGSGFTTRETAEKLHLSVKTIETYRDNIKSKLKIPNNPKLIRRAVLWVSEESSGAASND